MAAAGRWLIGLRRPPVRDELRDVVERDPVKVFRTARKAGWTVSEASNLAAYLCGLPIADGDHGMRPWTMPLLHHVLFLRMLYRRGEWS